MLLSHGLRAASGAKQFGFLEVRRNNADQTSYTETNVSLGTPHPNRVIIACVVSLSASGTPNIVNSVTINGTEMTLYQANSSGQAGWFGVLQVPSGTTATVVTTFNRTQSLYAIAFFRAVNLNSLVPIVTNGTTDTAASLSLSNTTPAGGFSIFGERHNNNNATTWTNVTSSVGGGTNGNSYDSFAFINNLLSSQSTQTVTTSWSGSSVSMLVQGTFK
jgi:hypothetical protein